MKKRRKLFDFDGPLSTRELFKARFSPRFPIGPKEKREFHLFILMFFSVVEEKIFRFLFFYFDEKRRENSVFQAERNPSDDFVRLRMFETTLRSCSLL